MGLIIIKKKKSDAPQPDASGAANEVPPSVPPVTTEPVMPEGPSGASKVGYGRPPKRHQFRKGRSGNPRGRPKRRMTIDQLLAREALRAVRIQQNGSPVTVTMVEALIKSIYAKAAKGDKTALTLIMAHLPRILEAENAKAETESRKEAEAILFGLAQRFKEAARKRSAANFDDAEIERRRLRLEEDERRAREKGDYSLDVGSILNEPMDED